MINVLHNMSGEESGTVFYDKKPRNYPDEFVYVTTAVFDGELSELWHNAKTGAYEKRKVKGETS